MHSLISIIIPVYNIPTDYLQDCLDSVLTQTYRNIEVIIINDCSPNLENDSTIRGYASKDTRIVYIPLSENLGVSNARNLGLSIAKGEWIMFVDSDDVLFDENSLEKLIEPTSCNIDLVCAYSRTELNPNGTEYIDEELSSGMYIISSRDQDYIRALNLWRYSACNKLFRSSLLTEVKFPVGITHFEDFIFLWQIALKNPAYILCPKLAYKARCRIGSVTRSPRTAKYFIEIIESCNYALRLLNDLYQSYPNTSRYLIAFILRESIVNKSIFDGLEKGDAQNVLCLLKTLYTAILANLHITFLVRLIVKLRLFSFQLGIIGYPKILYYMSRVLYRLYCRSIS